MAKIFIISGLSGAGKDSVIDGFEKAGLDCVRVITTTTRAPRSNESQGNPYYFVSENEFKKMISRNEFFEWAIVYDYYYGNTRKAVDESLATNKPVILRIDVQGARTVKEKIPEAKVIFITVSSSDVIKKRLENRGEDSKESIKKRVEEVEKEMKTLDQWDYCVVNKQGKLKQTIEEVKKIIKKEFNN